MQKKCIFFIFLVSFFFHGCMFVNRHHWLKSENWGVSGDELIIIGIDDYYKKDHPIGELAIGEISRRTYLSREVFEVRYMLNDSGEEVLPISKKILFEIKQTPPIMGINVINNTNIIACYGYPYRNKAYAFFDTSNMKELGEIASVGNHDISLNLFNNGHSNVYFCRNNKTFRFNVLTMKEELLPQEVFCGFRPNDKMFFHSISVNNKICTAVMQNKEPIVYNLINCSTGEIDRKIALPNNESLLDIESDNKGGFLIFAESYLGMLIKIYDNEMNTVALLDYSKYDLGICKKIVDTQKHRILLENISPLFHAEPNLGKVLIWDYVNDKARLMTLKPWR